MAFQAHIRRFKGVLSPDTVLAGLVALVLALLIVPLPAWFLDLCLSANLALSAVIVLLTLYVSRTLDISVFPSILLMTTLLRLGLNVASTRLILLNGYAGEVIASFGRLVVKGNYAVGCIVFFVLCVIQYLVIAKGGERVAEVSARFVLDAMPGKQMTIDADVRAGAIDQREARARRRMLERESQFYGAMDGAMKFVKGDVIAGFVITVTNLVGGFAIGTLERGLSATDAIRRYGLLAIGDGLTAQIPSIVLAVAAGMVVTRVAGEVERQSLAQDLLGQILGQPKAFLGAGVVTVLAGLVPGLPTIPFLVIGGLLISIAVFEVRHPRTRAGQESLRHGTAPRFLPQLVPLKLYLGSAYSERRGRRSDRSPIRGEPEFVALFDEVQQSVFCVRGVCIPTCRFECDPALAPTELRLEVRERVVWHRPDADDGHLIEPATLRGELEAVLLRHAGLFLGLTETQLLLDTLEELDPVTVRQVVPRVVSLSLLNDVLRRLVDEGVSIRDLSSILTALGRIAADEKSPLRLTELLRSEVRHLLYQTARGPGSSLKSVVLDPSLEDMIRMGITRHGSDPELALSSAALGELTLAVSRAIDEAKRRVEQRLVLLTAPDIRRHTRKLVEVILPDLSVLSYTEIPPELAIETVAVASLCGIDSEG